MRRVMMMTVMAVSASASAGAARAEGEQAFAELGGGGAVPVVRPGETVRFEGASPEARVWVGLAAGRAAIEVGWAYTRLERDRVDLPDEAEHDPKSPRQRLTLGARVGAAMGARARLVGRAAIGMDRVSATYYVGTGPTAPLREVVDVDTGVAVDVGVAGVFDVVEIEAVTVQVALHLGLAMGVHGEGGAEDGVGGVWMDLAPAVTIGIRR